MCSKWHLQMITPNISDSDCCYCTCRFHKWMWKMCILKLWNKLLVHLILYAYIVWVFVKYVEINAYNIRILLYICIRHTHTDIISVHVLCTIKHFYCQYCCKRFAWVLRRNSKKNNSDSIYKTLIPLEEKKIGNHQFKCFDFHVLIWCSLSVI